MVIMSSVALPVFGVMQLCRDVTSVFNNAARMLDCRFEWFSE